LYFIVKIYAAQNRGIYALTAQTLLTSEDKREIGIVNTQSVLETEQTSDLSEYLEADTTLCL
jgi:CRISPR/Cas system-associated endonuclease/helicase Cas3